MDTWATQLESSLNMGDWVTNIAYFLVFSICAPIWEEVRVCVRHADAASVRLCGRRMLKQRRRWRRSWMPL